MYQNILVATGGSPWSEAAVETAVRIAARTGAKLHILTVVVPPSVYASPDAMGGAELVADILTEDAQALLDRAAEQAHHAGITCATHRLWGNVPQSILQVVTESSSDLVVIGARMISGWKRLRLGNIANAVAAKAQPPVLVVKHPPPSDSASPFGQRLLVPIEGSPWSDAAVHYAIALAQSQRLSLCLLHVLPGRRPSAAAEADGERLIERGKALAAQASIPIDTVISRGDPTATIIDVATQEACDGIVLGSRGSSGWKRLMVGSISNAVAAKSERPVFIVKPSAGVS